jgi:aspartyl protease family protein
MRSILVFAALMLAFAAGLSRFLDAGVAPASTSRAQQPPVAAAAVVQPSAASGRSMTIGRDRRGHFQVEAKVDGRRLDFMVDTGASVIALTANDARRLGIFPSFSDFRVRVRTANGTVKAAPVRLGYVDVGGLVVRDVQALVIGDNALGENLLGLSYLTRLKRFEYAGGKLVLEN